MDTIRSVIGVGKKKAEEPKRPVRRKRYYDKISSISIPSYHLTKSGHVDYVVEVKKAGTTWQVLRRYTMFKKLHADLTSLCPMTTPYHCEYGVVPVLCGSSWTEVTNQSIELIEKRKFYLEVYLEQLIVSKNRFYQARTALYSFLHDDEVAVMNKPGTTPLPGLGASGGKVADDVNNDSMTGAPAAAPIATATPVPPPAVDGAASPKTAGAAASQGQLLSASVPKTTTQTMKIPVASDRHDDPMASLRSDPGPSYLSLVRPEKLSGSPALDLEMLLEAVCVKCGTAEQTRVGNFQENTHCVKCNEETRHAMREHDVAGKSDAATVTGGETGSDRQDSTSASQGGGRKNRPAWAEGDYCNGCSGKFSFLLRKHHCRRCGGIFCGYCSSFTHKIPDLEYTSEVRVCKACKDILVQGEHDTDLAGDDGLLGPAPDMTSAEFSEDGSAEVILSDTGEALTAPPVEQKQFSAEDFELVTTLGKGTFGKVMKVREKATGAMYAMKVLSKKVVHSRRMVEYVREEKDILASLSHPFIVHLSCAFQTAHHLYILMDFLPGGELYSHIYNQGRFGEVDAKFYISEMVLAIGYLHSRDIVHRDIKPENIVLDRQGHAVLTDFGLAKRDFSSATRRSFVGSSEYLPPETVRGEPQTAAVDWWSMGILLYEMLVGSAPFNGPNNNDVYQQILHKEVNFSNIKSTTCQNIIKGLLTRDVRKRLADEASIKAHPFFEDVDWDALYRRKVTPPFVPDLTYNDTKYFSKEFTHEWASIDEVKTGRNTLELLGTKFDNFAVAGKPQAQAAGAGTSAMPVSVQRSQAVAVAGGGGTGLASSGLSGSVGLGTSLAENNFTFSYPTMMRIGSVELDACTPADILLAGVQIRSNGKDEPQLMMTHPRDMIVGAWALKSLELISESGKVSYPWGSEVIGQAIYSENGQYSLQCTMTKQSRRKFKDDDYKRVDREEMAEAYITYVSSFGTYNIPEEPKYVSHFLAGSLCPNWADSEQKRYFRFVDGQGLPNKDFLVLATGVIGVDGMSTRTVMKFQRMSEQVEHPAFARKVLEEREKKRSPAVQAGQRSPSQVSPSLPPMPQPHLQGHIEKEIDT